MRQKALEALNSKTLPLDLIWNCYLEECQERKFRTHSISTFQTAINQWIRFTDTDLNLYLVKKFKINSLEKDAEIIKYY